ncbi:hypothetical protein H4R18_002587 [Coemansia javaensis]|uniref:Uncharacterized protein n=1 Tax=Coemansia javaensis TaxID=2761396 RepID=A0A9W8HBL8_9FUNG|nr:hypothetical protein H4R18_002587 [Coemansia javaensis]
MANIAATFVSGLLVGAGSAYAFAAYATDRARLVDSKLRWASAELVRAMPGERQQHQPLAPDVRRGLGAHLSDSTVPLAKAEWNSAVRSAAHSLTQIDFDADRLAAALGPRRDEEPPSAAGSGALSY